MLKFSGVKHFFFPILLIILTGVGCSPIYVVREETRLANIEVSSPLSQETVGNPIHVTGQARVFENVVSWRLKDDTGTVLVSGTTEAAALDMGLFGPFDFWITIPEVSSPNLILEVYQASAKDGSDTDLVSVPLILERTD